ETYFLASQVALSEKQKQDFLNKAIELDPFYEQAHNKLKSDVEVPTTHVQAITPASSDKSGQVTNHAQLEVGNNLLWRISFWLGAFGGIVLILGIGWLALDFYNGTRVYNSCQGS